MTIVHECEPTNILKLIKENPNVIVDIWAQWCGPCLETGEILEQLDKTIGNKVLIIKVDFDKISAKNPGSLPFWKDVKGLDAVPILIFFKNGKRVDEYIDERLQPEEKQYGRGLIFGEPTPEEIQDTMKKLAMV